MQTMEPIFVECLARQVEELTGIVIPVDSELADAAGWELGEWWTRQDPFAATCQEGPLNFGQVGPASELTVEISSESRRFRATAPDGESVVIEVPELGTWQDLTEQAAQVFGDRKRITVAGERQYTTESAVVAWRLTESGAAVTLAKRGGERLTVQVTELAK
jgi:hypothetical protein